MKRTGEGLRNRLVRRMRRRLNRAGWPRLQMTVMVAATGTSGFLCSYALLRLGLRTMWVRYAIAVACAYAVFLALVWLWLVAVKGRFGLGSILDSVDPFDLSSNVASSGGQSTGGAQAAPSHSFSFDLGIELDGEGILVVLAILAAVGVAVIAAGFVIAEAPALLAEVLVDGAFSVGLYRRLKRLEHRNWLESAVLRTRFPILWVLAFFILAGAVMQWYAPEAVSIGDVWNHLQANGGHGPP